MARSRRFIDDIAYAEEHRWRLRDLYPRIGHRIDMADRDWTEFCHHCKEPIAIIEQVRDVGQDIHDKATTITRRLAERAGITAFLMAWKIDRPGNIQSEIDRLGEDIMKLQTMHPITRFRVLQIHPSGLRRISHKLDPDDYWEEVLLLHRNHHAECRRAKANGEFPVHHARLARAKSKSAIWLPVQGSMSIPVNGLERLKYAWRNATVAEREEFLASVSKED